MFLLFLHGTSEPLPPVSSLMGNRLARQRRKCLSLEEAAAAGGRAAVRPSAAGLIQTDERKGKNEEVPEYPNLVVPQSRFLAQFQHKLPSQSSFKPSHLLQKPILMDVLGKANRTEYISRH